MLEGIKNIWADWRDTSIGKWLKRVAFTLLGILITFVMLKFFCDAFFWRTIPSLWQYVPDLPSGWTLLLYLVAATLAVIFFMSALIALVPALLISLALWYFFDWGFGLTFVIVFVLLTGGIWRGMRDEEEEVRLKATLDAMSPEERQAWHKARAKEEKARKRAEAKARSKLAALREESARIRMDRDWYNQHHDW